MAKKRLRFVTAADCLRIRSGQTLYDSENKPLTVKGLHWFGDYCIDIVECTNGRSYPATSLKILAAV